MIGTILWALIAGAVIGALGRLLLPGRQNISIWLTIGVGIAAALLGGVIATWLGIGETAGVDWLRHAIQVALAVFFVWIAARAAGHRPTDAPGRATR
ncbi:GlsB/YeaQ/YmgE family stress response membrane protein [Solwaraspora sp. WMMD791]|uniref:GlsB/YeaQ/YmgE family stress response membrane protein n=1 Tax=unclassified Solwaraspora TaxID=2627926 RepID=UPI00249A1CDE|nr:MULTISPECIES: GlsB/YeaQ/YmgE family stress response membrane protein [unclassified Solwaraspora]WFE27168.1 GlsB/YeaQ/YmgE family stress response membrane protein [Solwaraspora sp. WMMD791]WJK40176.1 GlsB/YeaQ/YmgE family stress response membrane protein [Solwaraspora sp. WMMA2056]